MMVVAPYKRSIRVARTYPNFGGIFTIQAMANATKGPKQKKFQMKYAKDP
jgi:hypothetical protein